MGMIIFENDPPYERLEAQSAQAIPTSDGVELVLSVSVEGHCSRSYSVNARGRKRLGEADRAGCGSGSEVD